MQPPSFDDFLRKQASNDPTDKSGVKEPFALEVCPTPGCGCRSVMPKYEGDQVAGFTCASGCVFSVRRNVFTGEIMYYRLDDMPLSPSREDPRGMKFSLLGEPYTDWY